MKLTPAMREAARLFGTMGGLKSRNQKEAGKASQRPAVKARRAATLAAKNEASRRLRNTTDAKNS